MYSFFNKIDFFSVFRFGFGDKRNCSHPICEVSDTIDNRNIGNACFVDITKDGKYADGK